MQQIIIIMHSSIYIINDYCSKVRCMLLFKFISYKLPKFTLTCLFLMSIYFSYALGNLNLTAGSNPGTFSSECPSEQTREGILDNVLQLISSQFDIHPIGLSRAFAASSCEQALSLHPHGSGHLFWILGENIQLQQCH